MANLTIAIEDELLQRARVRALQQGTSVNAVLRQYLQAWTDDSRSRQTAIREILDLANSIDTGSGGRRWTRDELHER
jgi:plasmid stability protein